MFDSFFCERGDVLSEPAVRSLAVQWKYSQPGAGEMVWDAVDRVGKGAFTNTGSALSGGLGLALTAMGRSEEGRVLTDLAEGAQVYADTVSDPRQEGTLRARAAGTTGDLIGALIPATAVARAGRIAGWSERAIAAATTVTAGGVGAAQNCVSLYREAKAMGASEEDARLAAGIGAIVGSSAALPVVQWALRLGGNSNKALRALLTLVSETSQNAAQGGFETMANNEIAQHYFDENRQIFDGVADAATVDAGMAAMVSMLTQIAAKTRLVNGQGKFDPERQRKQEIKWLNNLFSEPGVVVRTGDPVKLVVGIDLTDQQLANLAGAPKDGIVTAETDAAFGIVNLTVKSIYATQHVRTIVRKDDGSLMLFNAGLEKNKEIDLPRGFGTYVISLEVRTASKLGIRTIEGLAGGNINTPDNYIGYSVLPRFGFDTELSSEMRLSLPDNVRHAITLQDALATEEGRNWWRLTGSNQWVIFDLNTGSTSMKVLEEYLRRNGYWKL